MKKETREEAKIRIKDILETAALVRANKGLSDAEIYAWIKEEDEDELYEIIIQTEPELERDDLFDIIREIKVETEVEIVTIDTKRLREYLLQSGSKEVVEKYGFLLNKDEVKIIMEPDNKWRIHFNADMIITLNRIASIIVESNNADWIIPYCIKDTTSPWASALVQTQIALYVCRKQANE